MIIDSIKDFLNKQNFYGGNLFISDNIKPNNDIMSLVLDSSIDPPFKFSGCIVESRTMMTRYLLLYKSEKINDLGELLKELGKYIGKLKSLGYGYSLVDTDTTNPEYYYFLFDAEKENDNKSNSY